MAKSSKYALKSSKYAERGYSLLSLATYQFLLQDFSDAYHHVEKQLPVEIETVITEVLRTLPILPSSKDTLKFVTIKGHVATVRHARASDSSVLPSFAVYLQLVEGHRPCGSRRFLSR